MRVGVTVHFPVPPDRVFPYLAEPEKWPEWVPALVERTRIGEGPVRPGSQWRSIDRAGPLTIQFTEELVSIEPNKHVRFRQSSPWNSWGEYRVEPEREGSVVHLYFEGKPSGRIWWLNLVPNAIAAKGLAADLERLRRLLLDAP